MITFRNATQAELGDVLEWAAAEGWNPGLDDAAAFFATDPRGFFVAEMADALVAAISVVNHNDSFAFLGLYIVMPQHRGKGIGLRLWQHALEHASSRTVGLDGVAEQQDNYRTSGFTHAGGTTRFTGHVQPQEGHGIRLAQSADIPVLTDAEHAASGYRKCDYLGAWFTNTEYRKTLVLPQDDGSASFCTVRKCQVGAKVGP
ncbi:MAG: GNAT family N-acetyltransferase, partial [Roseobacter sp.]